MSATALLLAPLFALVAAAYASVGLGGGSGYLALMTLFGVPREIMPSTSLTLNIVVTGAAMLRFGIARRLKWRILLPFLLPAIPAAFAGGLFQVDRRLFLVLLAIGLGAAGAAMLRSASQPEITKELPTSTLWLIGVPLGVLVGATSGLLGIGGGVFLGPVVLLLGIADTRDTAAMCSAYILVLSVFGLLAHGTRGAIDPGFVLPLAGAVLIGGLAGAHLSVTRFEPPTLKRIFSAIVLVAAVKAALGGVGAL
jgi:uncharacterized membrane protein YfcA